MAYVALKWSYVFHQKILTRLASQEPLYQRIGPAKVAKKNMVNIDLVLFLLSCKCINLDERDTTLFLTEDE